MRPWLGESSLTFDTFWKIGANIMSPPSTRSYVKSSRRLLLQLAECLDSKGAVALASILSKEAAYSGSLEVSITMDMVVMKIIKN